jgi:hypothetical protein
MAIDHPFQLLFETLGRLPASHAESVNRLATQSLTDTLQVPVEAAGRCILLRAPRAGHGKTHLLSRVQHNLTASHEFIPLQAACGSRIDAASVIDDSIKRLLRPLPASGGLTVLDLVARRLFSNALQPLVASGEVPCQDRETALAALRNRPIETFDFNHPHAVTAHWARENFEVLGQRLSLELAQHSGLPLREVSFWVAALFHFAATPLEQPDRARMLTETSRAGMPGDAMAMDRLTALLGMLASLMRVVLVADDLEGFSADESAALRFSALLGALRQSVERLDVVLSLNQDIWESAFLPRLSGGLADRLSEVVIDLKPLTEGEMVDLLNSRAPGLGARVLEHIRLGGEETHARGLIRAAAVAWIEAERARTAPPPVMEAAPSAASPAGASGSGSSAAIAPVMEQTAPPPSPPQSPTVTDEVDVQLVPDAPQPPEMPDPPAAEEPATTNIPHPDATRTGEAPAPEATSPFTIGEEPGAESADTADNDRVDELLRQFRERYGRGSA